MEFYNISLWQWCYNFVRIESVPIEFAHRVERNAYIVGLCQAPDSSDESLHSAAALITLPRAAVLPASSAGRASTSFRNRPVCERDF